MKSKVLITLLFSLFLSFPVLGQEGNSQTEKPEVEASPVREEVQRYMGYENLLGRYITLPIDTTSNINTSNRMVDIGYLLLMWIPLILILGFQKRPLLTFSTIFLLLFISASYSHYSFVTRPDGTQVSSQNEEIVEYLDKISLADDPGGVLCAWSYQGLKAVFPFIDTLFEQISGTSDAITYPILIIFFLGGFFLLWERLKSSQLIQRTAVLLIYLFGFLWLILSAGIIWYGFLVLPMALLFLTYYFSRKKETTYDRLFRFAFFGTAGIFVLFAFILFLTNFKYRTDSGKDILDPAVLLYQTGQFTEEQVFDSYYTNLSKALQEINQNEDALVYRAGSMLSFFIRKNDKRVFEDNLLSFFDVVQKKYQDNIKIAEALKAGGFGYLIIGLRIGNTDRTPEGTLRKKFEKFINFLNRNPRVQLLATDNIVVRKNPNTGEEENAYAVFGPRKQLGTFAIYAIQ
jgi:hypothetical protein